MNIRLQLFFTSQGELWRRLLRRHRQQYYYTGPVEIAPVRKQRRHRGIIAPLVVLALCGALARSEFVLISTREELKRAEATSLRKFAEVMRGDCWAEFQKSRSEPRYTTCERQIKSIIARAAR